MPKKPLTLCAVTVLDQKPISSIAETAVEDAEKVKRELNKYDCEGLTELESSEVGHLGKQ